MHEPQSVRHNFLRNSTMGWPRRSYSRNYMGGRAEAIPYRIVRINDGIKQIKLEQQWSKKNIAPHWNFSSIIRWIKKTSSQSVTNFYKSSSIGMFQVVITALYVFSLYHSNDVYNSLGLAYIAAFFFLEIIDLTMRRINEER